MAHSPLLQSVPAPQASPAVSPSQAPLAPQCCESVSGETQRSPHKIWPAGQVVVGATHSPPAQNSPLSHATPQSPQLAGSFSMSTHAAPQLVSQLAPPRPEPHAAARLAPATSSAKMSACLIRLPLRQIFTQRHVSVRCRASAVAESNAPRFRGATRCLSKLRVSAPRTRISIAHSRRSCSRAQQCRPGRWVDRSWSRRRRLGGPDHGGRPPRRGGRAAVLTGDSGDQAGEGEQTDLRTHRRTRRPVGAGAVTSAAAGGRRRR